MDAVDVAEELSRDEGSASQYSLSHGILPPLGVATRSRRKVQLRRFIVSPFSPRYRLWEIFLVFLVFYTAWVSPFEFGFLRRPKEPISIIDDVVNGFFAIDIILTFFVAYLDKITYLLVDDHKMIAWRYASTWLLFDVISTTPYAVVCSILPDSVNAYGVFSMLRLWRLRRVSKFFARLEKDKNYSYFWIRCLKLLCVTLFVVHCAACLNFHMASHYSNPVRTFMALWDENFLQASLRYQYVTAFYWSITTLSTTGYGDIHAVNHQEMAFISCYMIFNMGLAAYVIGNMTQLAIHGTGRTRKYRDTIEAASSFAQRNQLPVRLQDQIIAHLCLRYRTDAEGLHQQEIIDSLPKAIRSSIQHYLFYPLADKVYLFHGVSNDLLFQLVSEMKAEYFPPGEDVILQNEAPTDFYILVTGTAEIIVRNNGVEQAAGEAQAGDVFGEVGVLCYRPQLFTVRTKRLSQLLRVNRTAFLNLVQANVGDGTIIMNNLLQHLKDSEDPVMKGILAETEHMLAEGKMDLPLSLCFAAARGDDLLMHHLLRRDLNPNERDNNGRSALHIAASVGNKHCVALLLEAGADPNIRDPEGSVPLWEAIVGTHGEVAKLLSDNGAKLTSGDVGHFACVAAELNNLDLLKDIIRYGGDVSLPNSNGSTALHTAVSEGNIQIIQFLLDQGSDIDKQDLHGWTPRALAEHQGHEEIKLLFQSREKSEEPQNAGSRILPNGGKPLIKYSSEPTMPQPHSFGALPPVPVRKWHDAPERRKVNNFRNSLFGIISATAPSEDIVTSGNRSGRSSTSNNHVARVTLSCPEKGDYAGRLVMLPSCLEELFEAGRNIFGFSATKALTKDGARIDDIMLVRDGDHIVLASDDWKLDCLQRK